MKKQYIVTKSEVEQQITNNTTLALFVRLFSGRYYGVEQDKLHSAVGMAKGTFNKAWKELVKFGYVVCSESEWIITDTPDALTNDSADLGGLFEQDNKLLDWLNKECVRVMRMQRPVTFKESLKLMNDYSSDVEKKFLMRTFKAMDNHPDLYKKGVSAYETVKNWMRNSKDKPTAQTGNKQDYVPTA